MTPTNKSKTDTKVKKTKAQSQKTKAQSQKTVSKTAKQLGFKNIKEAKNFLNSPDGCANVIENSPEVKNFDELNKEISRLMLDPCATDEYIVERTKYLIAKYKHPVQSSEEPNYSSDCCAAPSTKSKLEGMNKFFSVPSLGYCQRYDNLTITVH